MNNEKIILELTLSEYKLLQAILKAYYDLINKKGHKDAK